MVILFACRHKNAPVEEKFENKPEKLNDQIASIIKEKSVDYKTNHLILAAKDTLISANLTDSFYSANNFQPAWSDKGILLPVADSLLSVISASHDYGLIPEDYHFSILNENIKTVYDSALKNYSVTRLAETDLLLTDAFFKLCVHLNAGRMITDTLPIPVWKASQVDTDMVQLLFHSLKENKIRATLGSLEPDSGQYVLIKKFLSDFRMRYEKNPWDTLPQIQNDTATFYSLLPQRLMQSDDYDTTFAGNDSVKLAKALQSFQKKNGLIPDGKLGKNTIKLLMETSDNQIKHLEMTLEKLRWKKQTDEERYITINIPSFTFRLMEADTLVFKSRIICGLPDKQSPELDSRITHFYTYPYWTVPFSIATKEILPHLKRDTSYITKHNMDVLDKSGNIIDYTKVNWKKLTEKYFPYKLRQRDGDENTLGVLKFIFANGFGVYLHDTNAKNFFGKEVRALSHGCLRLEKSKQLAEYLVRDDTVNFTVDSLLLCLESKQRKRVDVLPPLPIHITYYTCEADSNGVIFYDDIYGRDEKMINVLYRKENKTISKEIISAKKD